MEKKRLRYRRTADTRYPELVHARGYPDERSFKVARGTLTRRFHEIFTQPIIEIGVVTGGAGTLYFNGRTYPLVKGDGYFLDMCHPHRHDPDGTLSNLYAHIQYDTIESLAPRDEFARFIRPLLLLQSGAVPPVIPRAERIARALNDAWQLYNGRDRYGYVLAWTKIIGALVEIGRWCDGQVDGTAEAGRLRAGDIVARALQYINVNAVRPVSLAQIAAYCSLSPSRLSAVFRSVMHVSPVAYRNRVRMERAVGLLLSTAKPVEEVAFECGFHSLAQFRVLLKRHTGRGARALRSQ